MLFLLHCVLVVHLCTASFREYSPIIGSDFDSVIESTIKKLNTPVADASWKTLCKSQPLSRFVFLFFVLTFLSNLILSGLVKHAIVVSQSNASSIVDSWQIDQTLKLQMKPAVVAMVKYASSSMIEARLFTVAVGSLGM